MDTLLQEFPNTMNRFKFDHGPISFPSNRNLLNGYELNHNLSNPISNLPFLSFNSQAPNDLTQSSPSSSEGHDPNNNAVLKYISDMLMEEDLEGKTCMLQDCLALQAAEKSLYDVLGQEYPHSLSHCPQIVGSPDDNSLWSSSFDRRNCYPGAVNSSVEKPSWTLDQIHNLDLYSTLTGPDFHSVRQGIGDASKFFSDGDPLVVAPNSSSPTCSDKEESDYSPSSSRGRKNHQREDSDYLEEEEERSNKHSALSLAESEQSEMFDEVLLCPSGKHESETCAFQDKSRNGASLKGSNGRTARGRRQGNKGEVVDLSTLLAQCAQSVSISDHRTATELLRQIRQHSSPYGDGNQRLAHYFANALETRLAGTGTPAYSPLLSSKTPVSDILKAYQVYVKACPFKRMSNFFANQTIFKLAEKATRLHIIDFGVLYGFQWPCLIQRLSQRPGGPPKLRITGIELPQPGFRPAERVEETGRRLQRYCERFNVPFKYHAVAQKWETIKYEDLNIDRGEMTVVNCLYRLRNLPDDTVVANSARDAVLKLIRKIRPDIFIHGVINGTYNAPFFVTRFREALFYYSALFDMFEINVPREDDQRMLYEKAIFGRDIMNVIACEGAERVERPETYKQWQVRNLRAGFRQLSLDQEILKKVRCTVRSEYHKDFVVDENGRWMLQGWKGRVISALSVWKPVQD
ncbi:transcription factor, putative [Ricinus communis]|uniref:Transcription factor, putative n=1 Tax=Ricinus communis TaxID=3988 RepID=B9T680_RICCO|nr:transcription factor, putative [Ricinus communis]|eukprot:XP_002533749.1 scarecrow-like protein 14 [Ricinus communis]